MNKTSSIVLIAAACLTKSTMALGDQKYMLQAGKYMAQVLDNIDSENNVLAQGQVLSQSKDDGAAAPLTSEEQKKRKNASDYFRSSKRRISISSNLESSTTW
jgi:hypothetical protein